jgi:hypothetical protein
MGNSFLSDVPAPTVRIPVAWAVKLGVGTD